VIKNIFPTPVNIGRSLMLFKRLIEQKQFKAVIDRECPLEKTVGTYRYVETGKKVDFDIFRFCKEPFIQANYKCFGK
jgi:hypothetical protein